jgi:ubiquinone/menaquinone biosynthesis C-methylase UbiE
MRFLNLACGDIFVTSALWENCDFAPKSKEVKQVNLLDGLPYSDCTFDLAYCSHYIEHIPKNEVLNFLQECNRVLKPGALIRLVLPNFENIAREYIKNIDEGNLVYAEFNIVEMVDQCTRRESGGELTKWYSKTSTDNNLSSYIKSRTGYEINLNRNKPESFLVKFKNLSLIKIKFKSQLVFSQFMTSILPRWFQLNHVSKTATGEKHLWVYDFNSISNILKQAGFSSIIEKDSHNSLNSLFPVFPLDVNADNETRKGAESMYIEAIKI